jgi:hypothetical protein
MFERKLGGRAQGAGAGGLGPRFHGLTMPLATPGRSAIRAPGAALGHLAGLCGIEP